jgi:hypothetical protein
LDPSPFLGALAFGCAAHLTIEACRPHVAPNRGSPRFALHVLRATLCAGAAMVGGIVIAHAVPPETLVALLVLTSTLATTGYLAVAGSVSPMIPGVALIVVVASDLIAGDVGPLLSAVALGLPFALTVFFTRDRDPNYRDTVIAALGGAVFGIQAGLLVVGFFCFATLLIRALVRRRAGTPGRIAFAPVLSAGLLVTLVGQLAIS